MWRIYKTPKAAPFDLPKVFRGLIHGEIGVEHAGSGAYNKRVQECRSEGRARQKI
jgi:hypothetical protein